MVRAHEGDGDGGREDGRGPGVLLAGSRTRDTRQRNSALILEILRTRGPLSRTALASTGALSAPTVLEIVDELMREGLVHEEGIGPSTGGRKPVLLGLSSEAKCSVGLAIESQTLTAVVSDLKGNVKVRLESSSELNEGPETLLSRVREILRRVLLSVPQGLGEPLGIGLALPAPVTASTGEVFSFPTRSEWGEVELGQLISREFDLPVLVDNVANAAAMGEHLFGAGRDARDMFYLLLHRGVGGASVMDGSIYRGADGGAGEVGHMRISLDGPRCGCGNHGCLEAYVGRVAIRERATRAMKIAGQDEMVGTRLEDLKARHVIEAGLGGDELAQEVLRETGRYVGIGILNVTHLLNPELVVVGGSTVTAGHLLLDPAAEVVRRQVLPSVTEGVRIVQGGLGEDAGALGAASLVLRELFAEAAPVGPMGGLAGKLVGG